MLLKIIINSYIIRNLNLKTMITCIELTTKFIINSLDNISCWKFLFICWNLIIKKIHKVIFRLNGHLIANSFFIFLKIFLLIWKTCLYKSYDWIIISKTLRKLTQAKLIWNSYFHPLLNIQNKYFFNQIDYP